VIKRLTVLCSALALLAGCATTQRLAAAGDVHSLLVAIRDDDQATFEAHVDRRALEAEIQSVMVEKSRDPRLGQSGGALGLLLSGPLSRVAGATLIQPEVFRAVAARYGYRPDKPIPGSLSIAAALTSLPDGTVCAKARRDGPCLLTFADEGGTWKLVAFDADTVLKAARVRRP
jgi:hypothetical protein